MFYLLDHLILADSIFEVLDLVFLTSEQTDFIFIFEPLLGLKEIHYLELFLFLGIASLNILTVKLLDCLLRPNINSPQQQYIKLQALISMMKNRVKLFHILNSHYLDQLFHSLKFILLCTKLLHLPLKEFLLAEM